MKKISVSEFRTHCYRWIEHVRKTREHVLITKRGVPFVKLVTMHSEDLPNDAIRRRDRLQPSLRS